MTSPEHQYYARRKNSCYEYLHEHLGLTAVITYLLYREGRKAERYKGFAIYALFSGLLHDIGKAATIYQRNSGDLSFPYHECLSTAIAHAIKVNEEPLSIVLNNIMSTTINILSPTGCPPEDLYHYLVLVPINRHHQGLRTVTSHKYSDECTNKVEYVKKKLIMENRGVSVDDIRKVIQMSIHNTLRILNNDVIVVEILNNFMSQAQHLRLDIEKRFEIPKRVSKDECPMIWDLISESRRVTGFLMIADNVATMLNLFNHNLVECIDSRLLTKESLRVASSTLCLSGKHKTQLCDIILKLQKLVM